VTIGSSIALEENFVENFFYQNKIRNEKLLYLTTSDKSVFWNLSYFGNKIRTLRGSKKLLLRQVAAYLEADTAMISKIERGERRATREQVRKIAAFLQTDENELLKLWLADKVYYVVNENVSLAEEAMEIVKKTLKDENGTETA
jgi:transcriptional regulator with XRE-family HTH domain